MLKYVTSISTKWIYFSTYFKSNINCGKKSIFRNYLQKKKDRRNREISALCYSLLKGNNILEEINKMPRAKATTKTTSTKSTEQTKKSSSKAKSNVEDAVVSSTTTNGNISDVEEELVAAEKPTSEPPRNSRGRKLNGVTESKAIKKSPAVRKKATTSSDNSTSNNDGPIFFKVAKPTKGRAKKTSTPDEEPEPESPVEEVKNVPKPRGRGKKAAVAAVDIDEEKDAEVPQEKPATSKGRSRKKAEPTIEEETAENVDKTDKKVPPKKRASGKKAEVVAEPEPAKSNKVEKTKKSKEPAKAKAKDGGKTEEIPKGKKVAARGKKRGKQTEEDIEPEQDMENGKDDAEPVTVATPKKKMKVVEEKAEKKKRGKAVKSEDPKVEEEIEENTQVKAPVEKKTTQRGRKRVATEITSVDAEDNDVDGAKPSKSKKAALNSTETCYVKEDFDLPPLENGNTDSSEKRYNLKISSWNVAGLRSWLKKDGLKFLNYEEPDIFCMQETKCTDDQLPEEAARVPGYHRYSLCKPGGYAGVAIYSKIMPINVEYGIGSEEFDDVGRIITAEYEKYFMICVYVPNSGRKLVNLDKRMQWEKLFQDYVKLLDERKPVIICGDMNVSHQEIDLANPKGNTRNAGFTKEERDKMTELLSLGYVDTFRHLYPKRTGAYTFWTYMGNARSRNVGWRLDYFLVSERLVKRVVDNCIRSQCKGSDHCPITLFLKL